MLTVDEGCRYKAYKDTTGHTTVGIGFNMDSPTARSTWIRANVTESFNSVYSDQCNLSTNSINSLLNTCIDSARTDLESLLPEYSTYPYCVQIALINLMFNLGKSVFSTFTGTIQLIKNKQFAEAAQHLLGTLWAREVPNRAKRVAQLFNNDYSGYFN